MVKLTAIGLLKSIGTEHEAKLLGIEADLSTFGFFQRGTVREMLTFVSRTAAQRTLPGQRQTVQTCVPLCSLAGPTAFQLRSQISRHAQARLCATGAARGVLLQHPEQGRPGGCVLCGLGLPLASSFWHSG